MINIEVCIKNDQSTTDKGRILEHLAASVLRIQQYDVVETVRLTGIEIDVLAKNRINSTKVFVECKAWDSALPGDVITKIVGNVVIKDADEGWLISTGPLSKDAEGLKAEWENRTDRKRGMLSFYTFDRVISLLIDANIIKDSNVITHGTIGNLRVSGNRTLMLTPSGMYWLIPVIQTDSNFITSIVVFNAETGERIVRKEQLDEIKSHKNSYSDYQWLSTLQTDNKALELLNTEYNSIVQVICGDDWRDYRPARPEDFVGRKPLLNEIFSFFKSVNDGLSPTRLFSIKAPSGMGKSSVVLKIASLANKKIYSNRFFTYCIDVRTAMSSRYVEMAIKACFDAADKAGFTDIKTRNIASSNITQIFEDPTVKNTLKYLQDHKRNIIVIFDQFEELFSKKELYGLFENVQALCNIVDALQGPIILGFAWKTDLAIPAEHPAYFMWSNLSDRRKEFEVPQFKASEIKSAIKVFGKQLGENINPILTNYLTKQCQGYPWLLKKLCIHVFKLIVEGNSQDSVIGQKLNIVDLFERDIDGLTAEQHACLKEIAKTSPADYFHISEIYGNDLVQSLIYNRLIIRRASKLTLYWDIFRDYVLNGTVPSLMLDYIPQQQFSSVSKILLCLIENGGMSSSGLGKKLSIHLSTIDNAMIDMVMFGVVRKGNDNIIHLVYDKESEIILALQNFFKKHIVYENMLVNYRDGFNYIIFMECFMKLYQNSNYSEKTKMTYCGKLYNWFIRLGLFVEEGEKAYVSTVIQKSIGLQVTRTSRRNRYSISSQENLFWGQSSPKQVQYAYQQIQVGNNSYRELKHNKLRNAIEILVGANAIKKNYDTLVITKTMEEIIKTISESPTIVFANAVLRENPKTLSIELGQLLNDEYQRTWTASSKMRYGNAIMNWVRYLNESKK